MTISILKKQCVKFPLASNLIPNNQIKEELPNKNSSFYPTISESHWFLIPNF